MDFGNLKYLYLLVLVLFLLIFHYFGYKKRDSIYKKLRILKRYNFIRYFLIFTGIILLVFSLSDPKILEGEYEIEKKGLDIYILIDTSKSMLTEDIKPNRLESAKDGIKKFVRSLKGDRVGYIPFASDAYIQMPLTDDYDMAEMFLEVIDTNMISGGGSNIGSAITLALNSLKTSSKGDKVIIVFTDGEQNDLNAMQTLENVKDDIKLFTVGVGTKKGALIPITNEKGEKEYLKDNSGNYVVSKLEIEVLKNLSDSGNGKFFISSISGEEIDRIINRLDNLKRGNQKTSTVKKYKRIFQYFLLPGIILFLLGYFFADISRTKK